MTRRRSLSFGIVAFTAFPMVGAGSAIAFSDPAAFSRPAIEGGGGGREFTGSPQDGLACGVCHGSAPMPPPTIEWRDLSGMSVAQSAIPELFQEGHNYSVAVRWNPEQASHALQLELVDGQGVAPLLNTPSETELPATARCDGLMDGPAAVYRHDLGTRQVIGVEDCGASELTFTFTAPTGPDLYFAMGMVRSNSDGAPGGDGVLELRRRLRASVGTAGGGCSAAGARPARWEWLSIALLALAVWSAPSAPTTNQSNRSERNSVVSRTDTSRSPTKAR